MADLQPKKIKRFGWRKDSLDHRDLIYQAHLENIDTSKLPARVDLRPGIPSPPLDQGELGSCTGNAIAKHLEFNRKKQGLPVFVPSRLFIYYNERSIEGTISEDAGAEIRDGLKSVGTKGAPPEEEWPYDISKFTERPSAKAYADGMLHRAMRYQKVPLTSVQTKGCLAAGFPFVFGFNVYPSFEEEQTARTGLVSMPNHQDEPIGGHAVMAVGYDDDMIALGMRGYFIVINSWGPDWGDNGFFYLPYQYMLNPVLASDAWTIRFAS